MTPSAPRCRFIALAPSRSVAISTTSWRPCGLSRPGPETDWSMRMTMKIAVGSDHRGFEAKKRIVALLENLGHAVRDMGADGRDSVDYPDYALLVGQAVSSG